MSNTHECTVCGLVHLPRALIEDWTLVRIGLRGEPHRRSVSAVAFLPEHQHIAEWNCWCRPGAERQPDGSYLFIHRKEAV